MKKSSSKFDLNIRKATYLNRLGLSKKKGKSGYLFVKDPNATIERPFPYFPEEAAYLLVGLAWQAYSTDFNEVDNKKIFIGNKRTHDFLQRNGHEVLQKIYANLGTPTLPDLDFTNLIHWGLQNSAYLKGSKDLSEQLTKITECLAGQHSDIPDMEFRQFWRKSAEQLSGHNYEDLEVRSDGYYIKDTQKGKRGQDHLRHRLKLQDNARDFKKNNSRCRFVDYYKSNEWKKATQGTTYTKETLKKWTKDLFSKTPGRPKSK